MRVVTGIDRLTADIGPVFVVIGVFDGLHRGHQYLLRHLVDAAHRHDAAPTVITFDHHPDQVLTGAAPPLLIDPEERLARLDAAGVAVTVVQHFDDDLRRTTYEAFVERIRANVPIAGFLMTPDAAFGFERHGTPEALAALGARDRFEVVVVPPFDLDGRPVHSAEIRGAIAAGDLGAAARLLGRPVTLSGACAGGRLAFEFPMALPPDGAYRAMIDGRPDALEIRDGVPRLGAVPDAARLTVELA